MFCYFGHEACGILAPWPGIKPATPALEGEVLAPLDHQEAPGPSFWISFPLRSPQITESAGGSR